MAPKRKKTTRMDAALDQMSNYGFSRPLVRKTVTKLLKKDKYAVQIYKYLHVVHNGTRTVEPHDLLVDHRRSPHIPLSREPLLYGEEWIFIEENGYRILIDVILEEQETETGNLLKDASSLHDNPGKELVTAEHSNDVAAEGASLTNNAESNEKPLLPIEGVSNVECVMDDILDQNVAYSKCSCDVADNPVNVPNLKHKPCYGWISDDDSDNEIYFVKVKPST